MMEEIGQWTEISGATLLQNFMSRKVTYADVWGGTRAQILLHRARTYGNHFTPKGGPISLSGFGEAVLLLLSLSMLPARTLLQLELIFQHSPLISTAGNLVIPKHFLT